ncbi:glutathione S-transferase [Russula brevipes]|nr:glutathione S-transferase [Russula brevipes]
MAFRLYGFTQSTSTRRVSLIARELNIPYEVVVVNAMVGEHKQPPHLAHQPFGQVPYIVMEDGFELFESRAISRHLVTLGTGPQLIPTEPRARAKFEQAASVECTQFDPIAANIFRETALKQLLGQTIDEERVKAHLPSSKYLAGDEVTLADLFHLPYGSIIFDQFGYGGLDKRPNVERWWKDISSRPAWRAVKDGI